jgi:hypothetical protein
VHIQQQGYSIHIFGGKFEISKDFDNMVVMTGVEYGRLLKLNRTSIHAQNFAYLFHHGAGTMPSSLLWHARFGHINYDSLYLLRKNGVSSLSTILRNLKQCDVCILGKHIKQPFHDSTYIACRKIELIHSNFCGPMCVSYTNGNRYIMNFIDDYTRMCWLYLIKEKSQYFETFKIFHVWIQNETQSRIGSLRTDNGREYTSNEFESYLFQHGINHQTKFPYNPQQNVVAKRMNRTLLNMVCSMMFFKNVKLVFWANVVLCASYVKNMYSYHSLKNKTSYEM